MNEITQERLQQIVDVLKKPKLSIRKLEQEAGLPQSTFNKMAKGEESLTAERLAKLHPVLKKHNLI